nr:hypothetical protein [uncultured Flavobacterium sp.]
MITDTNFIAVIAIDFDGTICENQYPDIGPLRGAAAVIINALYDLGYGILINTCRTGQFEQNARDFLALHGIKYHLINENFQHLIDLYDSDSRKLSADVYIDDKCLQWTSPTWTEKFLMIETKFRHNPEWMEKQRLISEKLTSKS